MQFLSKLKKKNIPRNQDQTYPVHKMLKTAKINNTTKERELAVVFPLAVEDQTLKK